MIDVLGITFSQYSPAYKKKCKEFIIGASFFRQHAQDQCVVLKRTHFAVPPLRHMSTLYRTAFRVDMKNASA